MYTAKKRTCKITTANRSGLPRKHNTTSTSERDGKLVALVCPDYEAMDSYGVSNRDLPMAMEEVRNNLNKMLAPYEQITRIQLYPNEFEKTPKRSIKRYLYDN